MKPPLHIREINRARDWHNPLRGLNVQRVVSLLEEGERGKYDDLQKLNRMAEKRHPTLRALKWRRLSALKKLDWNVKLPDTLPRGITAAQAEAQRVFLRQRYELIENLPQAIEHLALATFRGFSHLEKRHLDDDASLPIVRLQPVPQPHWVRDGQDFDVWKYDADARGNETSAVAIDRAQFIIREVDDPLCEIALLCFVRRGLAKRNWSTFQEDYALTTLIATLGENTPLDKVKEWLDLIKGVTGNSRMVLPPGAEVKGLDLGNLDGVQFDNFIKAEDADLVLAGTGGLLTMLTANTGLGGDSQGDNHEAAFDALAIAEAAEVSALLQAQHDKPLLNQEFPSQPAVAYFELAAQDREDLDALAERLAKLKTAGFTAKADEVSEKFAITLEANAAPAALDPAAPGGDPAAVEPLKNRIPGSPPLPAAIAAGNERRFLSNAEQQLAAADLAVLAPVVALVRPIRAELARLADLTDDAAFTAGLEALQPALRRFQAALPALEEAVLKGRPDLDDAFSDIIATAFRSGLEEAAAARTKTPLKTAKQPPSPSAAASARP